MTSLLKAAGDFLLGTTDGPPRPRRVSTAARPVQSPVSAEERGGRSSDAGKETASQQRARLLRELKALVRALVSHVREAPAQRSELGGTAGSGTAQRSSGAEESKGPPTPARALHGGDPSAAALLRALEACLLHGMRTEGAVSLFALISNLDSLCSNPAAVRGMARGRDGGEALDAGERGAATRAAVHRAFAAVRSLKRTRTMHGKARAWCCEALNEGVLDASLSLLRASEALLRAHYLPHALMREAEGASLFVAMLVALRGLHFGFTVDSEAHDVAAPRYSAAPADAPLEASQRPRSASAAAAAARIAEADPMPGLAGRISSFTSQLRRISVEDVARAADAAVRSASEVAESAATLASAASRRAASVANEVIADAQRRSTPSYRRVFGVSLEELAADEEHSPLAALDARIAVPELPAQCLELLEAASNTPGLFLAPVAASELESLRSHFCSTHTVPMVMGVDSDAHAVAGLLLLFLAELPEPLLTDDRYHAFLSCAGLPSDARTQNLRALVNDLPTAHALLLYRLTGVLGRTCRVHLLPAHDDAAGAAAGAPAAGATRSVIERHLSVVCAVVSRVVLRRRAGERAHQAGARAAAPPVPPRRAQGATTPTEQEPGAASATREAAPQTPGDGGEDHGAQAARVLAALVAERDGVFVDCARDFAEWRASLDARIAALSAVHAKLGESYDPTNGDHVGLLRQLWDAIVSPPGAAHAHAFASVSPLWMDRGFQREDPTTDFRGGGVLALECLVFFATRHGDKVRQILQTTARDDEDLAALGADGRPVVPRCYPFALAGVNLTRMIAELVHLTGESQGVEFSARALAAGCPEFWRLSASAAGEAFHHLYCVAFLLLDRRWRESGASITDFSDVMAATKADVAQLLATRPSTPDALWHAVIARRAVAAFADDAAPPARALGMGAGSGTGGGGGAGSGNSGSRRSSGGGRAPSGDRSTDKPGAAGAGDGDSDGSGGGGDSGSGSGGGSGGAGGGDGPGGRGSSLVGKAAPRMLQASELLSARRAAAVEAALPAEHQGYAWSLAYSLRKHGASLDTLYARARDASATASVLVLRTAGGHVLGSFVSQPWHVRPAYYGSGQTFVFTFGHVDPDDDDAADLRVFRWSRANNYFVLASEDSVALGGGGHFAVYLDRDLFRGSSGECATFASPCLAEAEDFDCVALELWCFRVPEAM